MLLGRIRTVTKNVVAFYVEGFRSMTVGRYLWALIIVKLVLIFLVMKLLFFPDLLKRDFATDEERASHVREQLYSR